MIDRLFCPEFEQDPALEGSIQPACLEIAKNLAPFFPKSQVVHPIPVKFET
jgi:hypothetical protein